MTMLTSRRNVIAAGTAAAILGIPALGAAKKPWVNTRAIPLSKVPDASRWLLGNFRQQMVRATNGTPFSPELACAMACQESAYEWINPSFRKGRTVTEVLRLIVLDASDTRGAFPTSEAQFRANPTLQPITDELIAAADAARDARGVTRKRGSLMYGYGLFQYDLQNSLTDPEFWLAPAPGFPADSGKHGLWGDIDACLDRWCKEMNSKYKAAHGNLGLAVELYNGRGPNARLYRTYVLDNLNEIRRAKIV